MNTAIFFNLTVNLLTSNEKNMHIFYIFYLIKFVRKWQHSSNVSLFIIFLNYNLRQVATLVRKQSELKASVSNLFLVWSSRHFWWFFLFFLWMYMYLALNNKNYNFNYRKSMFIYRLSLKISNYVYFSNKRPMYVCIYLYTRKSISAKFSAYRLSKPFLVITYRNITTSAYEYIHFWYNNIT